MSAYLIFRVSNVTDPERMAVYRDKAPATFEKYGGRPLAAGGRTATHEGPEETARLGIIEFPSYEAADTWINSPEYQALKAARAGAADLQLIILDGLE